MLTGTWLESAKLLAGLFFLLLLLLLLPPPELIVLPPDIFRFLRLLGACLAGSAGERTEQYLKLAWDPAGYRVITIIFSNSIVYI